jgi:hypothetical protein
MIPLRPARGVSRIRWRGVFCGFIKGKSDKGTKAGEHDLVMCCKYAGVSRFGSDVIPSGFAGNISLFFPFFLLAFFLL